MKKIYIYERGEAQKHPNHAALCLMAPKDGRGSFTLSDGKTKLSRQSLVDAIYKAVID